VRATWWGKWHCAKSSQDLTLIKEEKIELALGRDNCLGVGGGFLASYAMMSMVMLPRKQVLIIREKGEGPV